MADYSYEKKKLFHELSRIRLVCTIVEILFLTAAVLIYLRISGWPCILLLLLLVGAVFGMNYWTGKAENRILTKTLQEIVEETDTIRLHLKNARLSALVSQMDPHFLFNTLQLLQDEFTNGSPETSCRIIQSLSDIYRYSTVNSRVLVPLRDELAIARSYMSIYEQVYEGNLKVVFNTAADCDTCSVPKFILQPILENAIKHGFDNAPYKNSISVSTFRRDDRLLIEIEDDGIGLSEAECARLQERIWHPGTDDRNGGIGLHNVHQRIQLLCGKSYGLRLYSGDPKGLRVELCLTGTPGPEPARQLDGGELY